jgi:hypothetical protein
MLTNFDMCQLLFASAGKKSSAKIGVFLYEFFRALLSSQL